MVSRDLLEILVCPKTKLKVLPADSSAVETINSKIRQGIVRNIKGSVVNEQAEELLIRADGQVAYPVKRGIPIMLVDEALDLSK